MTWTSSVEGEGVTHAWAEVCEGELEGCGSSGKAAIGKGDDGSGEGKPRGQDLGRRAH